MNSERGPSRRRRADGSLEYFQLTTLRAKRSDAGPSSPLAVALEGGGRRRKKAEERYAPKHPREREINIDKRNGGATRIKYARRSSLGGE